MTDPVRDNGDGGGILTRLSALEREAEMQRDLRVLLTGGSTGQKGRLDQISDALTDAAAGMRALTVQIREDNRQLREDVTSEIKRTVGSMQNSRTLAGIGISFRAAVALLTLMIAFAALLVGIATGWHF